MKLADKVFIKEAIALLEAHKKPLDHVLHSLINEENLTTYFDVNVDASESTGYDMMTVNQDGDELPYVNGNPPESIEGSGKKIIEASVEKSDVAYISVLRFEHEGKQYCGTDSDGDRLRLIYLDSDSIYFDRSDFDSYVDKPSYQDKNHEHYAPQLDLAIQLHKAIHITKVGNTGQSRLDRVSSWLNTTYPNQEFSSAEIGRLSAVIGTVKPNK